MLLRSVQPRVGDEADDFESVPRRIEANPHALAKRIGVPEQPAGEALAENRHARTLRVVAPLEVAPLHNGNADRGKESRRDRASRGHHARRFLCFAESDDRIARPAACARFQQ